MRGFAITLSLCLVAGLAACKKSGTQGGTEADTTAADTTTMAPAGGEAGAMGEMSMPSWMQVDQTAKTVTLDIQAGQSDANNHWNYNGLYAGHGHITVPQGYKVTINFTNADPTQPHSLGIDKAMETWPATFDDVKPAFQGALTKDATTGTPPNGTETLNFTVDQAGDYAMVCYVPGHAVAGMHVPFTVSADGQAGVQQ